MLFLSLQPLLEEEEEEEELFPVVVHLEEPLLR
jgi:hypothetical protein